MIDIKVNRLAMFDGSLCEVKNKKIWKFLVDGSWRTKIFYEYFIKIKFLTEVDDK